MKNIFLIIVLSFLMFISCDTKPNYVDYINVEQKIPKIKLSITVYISKRINSDELQKLAEKIYDEYDGKNYENVFIVYLLPNMEFGKGSYAISHYNPELSLKINELTEDEIIKIKHNFPISKRYWIDGKMLIEIGKEKHEYYVKQFGDDLSTGKKLLTKEIRNLDTIYRFHDNDFGEYYLLDSNNDLSIYDKQGYICSYSRE